MGDSKIKKLPFSVKFTITLVAAAVVFLALSIVSANYSVSRTVKAIEDIGTVDFSDASKAEIDLALSYYSKLDPNLDLEKKVTNTDKLSDAKNEYVRLAIKAAYLADKNGDEKTGEYVARARQIFTEYCSAGECANISNYEDLTYLEEKYSSAGNSENSSGTAEAEPAEEIELC